MTEAEAIEIATKHVIAAHGRKLPQLSASRSTINSSEWDVVFQTLSRTGTIMDGPTIVIVDDNTARARFFDSL